LETVRAKVDRIWRGEKVVRGEETEIDPSPENSSYASGCQASAWEFIASILLEKQLYYAKNTGNDGQNREC
jgi:hypothetical protein